MIPKEYWIWLQLALGQGSSKIDDILLHFDTPLDFYQAGEEGFLQVRTLTATDRDRLKRTRLQDAKKVIAACKRIGCRILTPDDPGFPERLRNIYGMPGALYMVGELGEIDRTLAVAMVGTRRPDDYGISAAKRIGYDLAKEGAVIVSGCAQGIDTVCHQAALAAKRPTVGFLGCGLDIDYPKSNHELKKQIARTGALITEYPPGTLALGRHFPVRNRLISGLALGTVVVQAPQKSGSLITADFALEQGKDVFALPGSIFSNSMKGNFQLLKQGAVLVDSAGDVLAQYRGYLTDNVQSLSKNSPPAGLIIEKDPVFHRKPEKKPFTETAAKHTMNIETMALSGDAKAVWNALSSQPMAADEIFSRVNMMMGNMLAALTELEILGLCQSYPGNRFGRSNQ